jgi:ABC-type lipoprotein release transport system permease subunit
MNPLSPITYYIRHKGNTLLLVGLIALVTTGIEVMVGMAQPILDHNTRSYVGFLSHLGLVRPVVGPELDPAIVSQIRTHPDVARVIPENGSDLVINIPSIVFGASSPVLGVRQEDVTAVLDACALRLSTGRILRPNTNEFVISIEFAEALGLRIGDTIGRGIAEEHYPNIEAPMVLVGTLESDPTVAPPDRAQVIIASYEYLASHEAYRPRTSGLLVIARENRKGAVDDWLEQSVASPHAHVQTASTRMARLQRSQRLLQLVLGTVDGLVAVIAALVVGTINRLSLIQRSADLGTLHAIGYLRERLVRRLTLEIGIVACIGFLVGSAMGWLVLTAVKAGFYGPQGVFLELGNVAPLWFGMPIPLTVIAFAWFSASRLLQRLDTVAIMDRGDAGTEAQPERRVAQSSRAPLSSRTFYQRHRRRSIVLVAAMALMIVGVAFPAFFFLPMIEAQKPYYLNYLRYVTRVEPNGVSAVDPTVIAQIKTHAAVRKVVRVQPLEIAISIPPMATNQVPVYGCAESDIPVLMDLFGLSLQEGRLPQVRSNEVVLSEALVLNRGLEIGDVVGKPAYQLDAMPTELVVVGILSPGDVSLGFASLEYLEKHERYARRPVHLFVVPAENQKPEVDTWLEQHVSSAQTRVETYAETYAGFRQARRGFLALSAVIECIIAGVAALALAALNAVFLAQRRREFGILHAMGRGRPWLVLRTTGEATALVATSWVTGAAICLVILFCAQAGVYAPSGVPLNLADTTPWLFTLPVPLAVVAVTVGLVARMLRRLDAVAIIESK